MVRDDQDPRPDRTRSIEHVALVSKTPRAHARAVRERAARRGCSRPSSRGQRGPTEDALRGTTRATGFSCRRSRPEARSACASAAPAPRDPRRRERRRRLLGRRARGESLERVAHVERIDAPRANAFHASLRSGPEIVVHDLRPPERAPSRPHRSGTRVSPTSSGPSRGRGGGTRGSSAQPVDAGHARERARTSAASAPTAGRRGRSPRAIARTRDPLPSCAAASVNVIATTLESTRAATARFRASRVVSTRADAPCDDASDERRRLSGSRAGLSSTSGRTNSSAIARASWSAARSSAVTEPSSRRGGRARTPSSASAAATEESEPALDSPRRHASLTSQLLQSAVRAFRRARRIAAGRRLVPAPPEPRQRGRTPRRSPDRLPSPRSSVPAARFRTQEDVAPGNVGPDPPYAAACRRSPRAIAAELVRASRLGRSPAERPDVLPSLSTRVREPSVDAIHTEGHRPRPERRLERISTPSTSGTRRSSRSPEPPRGTARAASACDPSARPSRASSSSATDGGYVRLAGRAARRRAIRSSAAWTIRPSIAGSSVRSWPRHQAPPPTRG